MSVEMWNDVEVFGPWPEIDRFVRLCIVPAPAGNPEGSTLAIDFGRVAAALEHLRLSSTGSGCATWNFRLLSHGPGASYSFAFDTSTSFPVEDMEDVARLFPRLAFDCECIAADDSSMGYGWFNTPAGGQDFFDGYDVPRNYWKTGRGHKRGRADQRRHASLKRELERRFGDPDAGCPGPRAGPSRGAMLPLWSGV